MIKWRSCMSKDLKIRIAIMSVILFAFVTFMVWNEKNIIKSNYSSDNIDEIKISFDVMEDDGKTISVITYSGTITDEKKMQEIVEHLNQVYFIKEPRMIQDLTEYSSVSGRCICVCTFSNANKVVDYRVFNFLENHTSILDSDRKYISISRLDELKECILNVCETSDEIDKEVKIIK